MTRAEHLTEAERQGAADGTLAAEEVREVREHLDACASCSRDVARLEGVVMRARERAGASESEAGDDPWPEIKARIDRSKVVRMDSSPGRPAATSERRRPWLAIASIAIAATLLIAAFAEMQLVRVRAVARGTESTAVTAPPTATTAGAAFANTVDSSSIYEAQAQVLLRELEMQRAMMRPSTSASLDGDLAIIDKSIAEQKEALARDPHNVSLQQLLAASYRQKVELLERANNAG